MRHWHYGLGFSLSFGLSLGFGCAATSSNPTGVTGAGGSTSGSGGAGGTITVGSGMGGTDIDSGNQGGMSACAKFTKEAKQAPAAMLFVLDRSASMSQQNKWSTAQQAVAFAIDKDAFDTMSLGMVTFPNNFVSAPACLQGLVAQVACGVSGLPQIQLKPAGTDKSNAPTGVRHDMYQYLLTASPLNESSDSSPIYDALKNAYEFLKLYDIEKRIAVLITDGGFSCTSVSSPTRPGYSDGLCLDWEYPDTVNALIKGASTDPDKPINTFVVGVPGSNSKGEVQGSYATAPYHMRLALSTYAVNGSPETIDPACDKDLPFTKNGGDPIKPCHFDLSSGAVFNPDALANAIASIRGKALGCTYDLPAPPPGEVIDPGLVNVSVTVAGQSKTVLKRSNPADTCQADGCWDYNSPTQIQLIGKTCVDVSASADAKVDIQVGCATVVK